MAFTQTLTKPAGFTGTLLTFSQDFIASGYDYFTETVDTGNIADLIGDEVQITVPLVADTEYTLTYTAEVSSDPDQPVLTLIITINPQPHDTHDGGGYDQEYEDRIRRRAREAEIARGKKRKDAEKRLADAIQAAFDKSSPKAAAAIKTAVVETRPESIPDSEPLRKIDFARIARDLEAVRGMLDHLAAVDADEDDVETLLMAM